MKLFPIAACALLAACATEVMPPAASPPQDSLLPGTIGVLVGPSKAGVVVAAVREGIWALRKGDLVVRYEGVAVTSVREFNRMVLESPPGSVASLELLRDGARRWVEMPVREIDTMPRV
jgi:S1-C subfamily serine protease